VDCIIFSSNAGFIVAMWVLRRRKGHDELLYLAQSIIGVNHTTLHQNISMLHIAEDG